MDYRKVRGIVIDSGHGGLDGGATGNGILEKDVTLKIGKYLYDRFTELGIPTKMTRTEDETLPATPRVQRVLDAFGNYPDVIVLSNHINAGGGDGAEIVYALRNDDTLAKLVLKEIGNKGQNIRKVYQRRLPSDPSRDYYYILRETGNTQPLLIEYGLLDSKGDDVNQIKNNILNIAEGVVKGVTEYIEVPYTPPGSNNDNNTYIVQKGDSLWKISQMYGIKVDDLINANNLNNTTLSIGQEIIIPKEKEENILTDNIYIVQKGDTLWNISKRYNTTVDELKTLNNLTSNTLSIGQQLIIPSNTYTVVKGDTLYSISKKFNISLIDLINKNNLTSDILSIGQVLSI